MQRLDDIAFTVVRKIRAQRERRVRTVAVKKAFHCGPHAITLSSGFRYEWDVRTFKKEPQNEN
jgi:hypothetical protein